MTKIILAKRIVLHELIGFLVVIAFLWIDEIFDVPHHIFGSEATPVNWIESALETGIVIFIALLIMSASLNCLGRVRHLEGFLRVCSFCKRIKTKDDWIPLDQYIRDYSEADLSHGLCPDCAEKHYGVIGTLGD